jgi:hypothetical protein
VKYPTIDDRTARAYIDGRRGGQLPSSARPEFTLNEVTGDQEIDVFDVVEGAMEALDLEARANSKTAKNDKDAVEGDLAVTLFAALRALPSSVLTDRGFWRFVAVYWMFDFIQWRDGENCRPHSFGAQEGLGALWDCVPLRMFDRALISERAAEGLGLSDVGWGARVAGTDLWRSHILRVLIGNAPNVVQRVLEDADKSLLPTSLLRKVVKDLQRTRSNVMFEVLDPDDARALVDEHRAGAASKKPEVGEAG